jgi:hypothetical protein
MIYIQEVKRQSGNNQMKRINNSSGFWSILLILLLSGWGIQTTAQQMDSERNFLSAYSLYKAFRPDLSHSDAVFLPTKMKISGPKQSSMLGYQLPTAFFCKIEDKIEKQSQIPFRFRLGSLNYVNMLENKGKDFIFVQYQH